MATLSVNYDLTSAEIGDVYSYTIKREPDGVGGFTVVGEAHYQIRDTGGTVRETGTLQIPLTAPQIAALVTHLTDVVVPAINTNRGIV